MTTLTERYLNEVARHLPQHRREAICDELGRFVADTVASRSPEASDRPALEHDVLTEMGEPSVLAASYSGQRTMLIGPTLYARYISLLKMLLGTLLPLFVVGYGVLELTDGRDVLDIVLSSVVVGLNLGAQLFTLVTVVFAVLDRTNRTRTDQWTASELPDKPTASDQEPSGKPNPVGLGASIAVQFALLVLIVWQHQAAPYTLDHGEQVPVLNPALFSGWIWPILAGLVGLIILDVIRASGQNWTIRSASLYTVPEALFFLPLAWVFSQQLIFDQRFLTDFNNGWHTPDEFYTGVALILTAWIAISTFDRLRNARKPQ